MLGAGFLVFLLLITAVTGPRNVSAIYCSTAALIAANMWLVMYLKEENEE